MHILVATDGSDEAKYALKEAARLLSRQAKWSVLAVADPGPVGSDLGYFESPVIAPHPDLDAALVEAEARCRVACRALVDAGIPNPDSHVATGDPAGTILGECSRLGVDVLVVGTHGRGWLGRLFLGSVSESLVHQFRSAVFVARHAAD